MKIPSWIWLSLPSQVEVPPFSTWSWMRGGKWQITLALLRSAWEQGDSTCMISPDFSEIRSNP